MLSTDFSIVAHWLSGLESYLPAILVTVGAALLFGCGVDAHCAHPAARRTISSIATLF